MNAPRASGSGCGVRSPARYGANSRPSLPGGQRAASASSVGVVGAEHAAEPGGASRRRSASRPSRATCRGRRGRTRAVAPARSGCVGGERREDDARGAEDDGDRARARDPDAERGRGLVAGAGDLGRLVARAGATRAGSRAPRRPPPTRRAGATSKRSVPEASATSIASSPVRRSRT